MSVFLEIVGQINRAYAQFKDASRIRSILDRHPNLVKECSEVAYPLEDEKTVEPPVCIGGFRPVGHERF